MNMMCKIYNNVLYLDMFSDYNLILLFLYQRCINCICIMCFTTIRPALPYLLSTFLALIVPRSVRPTQALHRLWVCLACAQTLELFVLDKLFCLAILLISFGTAHVPRMCRMHAARVFVKTLDFWLSPHTLPYFTSFVSF